MKHPKEITLTEEQVDTLRSTIQILELDASLKTILTGLLDNHIWLQHELHEKKISMSRLKSYFGIKSEKHAKDSRNDKETPSSEGDSDDGGDSWSGPRATPVVGIVPDQLIELRHADHAGRELIHVALTQQDRPGVERLLDREVGMARDVFVCGAGRRRRQARHVDAVLHAERDAV